MVIYDPESVLDEHLMGPPVADFRHITDRMTPEQLSELVGFELERSARLASATTKTKEPWRDLLIGESQPMRELHAMIRLSGRASRPC